MMVRVGGNGQASWWVAFVGGYYWLKRVRCVDLTHPMTKPGVFGCVACEGKCVYSRKHVQALVLLIQSTCNALLTRVVPDPHAL